MPEKSRSTAFLLCYFLGLFGVHRFYLGKVVTGLAMLVTLGGLTIWWLIDAVLIAAGLMKDKEGQPLRQGPPDPDDPRAGFWVRAAAYLLDGLIINVGVSVLATGASIMLPLLAMGAVPVTPQTAAQIVWGTFGAITLAAFPLYFAILTASRHQATWGKRCFDIYVATADGARVGFGRALWRSLCYLFSSLILFVGFVMAGLTREKRALHDYMAGTRVLYVSTATATAPTDRVALPPRAPDPVPDAEASAVAPVEAAAPTRLPEAEPARVPTWLMAAGALLLAAAAAAALL